MNFFKARDQTKLFFKDMGEGSPVILIHGWPLSADMWDEQAMALLDAGYRVIAYDRRGFGRSEQPATGYDYDTFAGDLHSLIQHLDLQKVSLVGFSMGGGEVARYLSRYGAERIACVSLIASIVPYMLKTEDNPDGVPESKFQEIEAGIRKDRFAFFHSFFKDFFGVNLISHPTSDQTLAWAEIGTEDKTVPIATSGQAAARLIPHATFKSYGGAPHGLNVTHKLELNQDLILFL